MRVAELKALTREHGLRGYSWMRKPDIIELIRNNQQSWAPDIPRRPNQTQSVRFRTDHPRQPLRTAERAATAGWGASASTSRPLLSGGLSAPTQQEMDIFEQ